MIGTEETWDLGFKGEEQVVAILDTGIDYTHRDMILDDGVEKALDKNDIENADVLGKYFTEKVPYGYNYYDLNNEVIDKGPSASMHGMHVAGTAGANGDTDNGGIKGVAPDAQLLAMKVFSNDPMYSTTFSDIYLVAIEEAITLGADVINMSLGSPSGFYNPDSPENKALKNAEENGIVSSISAGNSGTIVDGWTGTNYGFPLRENPDIGVVGSPGLNEPTISVASIENIKSTVPYLRYTKDDEKVEAAMAIASSKELYKALPDTYEYVYGGLGGTVEEVGDVEGKIALIQRGEHAFTDKITNADEAGAMGVIIFNSESGGDELMNMQYPSGTDIPAAFIGNTAGKAMMDAEVKEVEFPEGVIEAINPNGGKMSDFSSWGTTPSLELKPELTAPGGQIYSTLNNDKYGVMSGTSMAAPHVAGGSALALEYIKEKPVFNGISSLERVKYSKALLMNTSKTVTDDYGVEISPRRQGAGLMDLHSAVSTPVIVVDSVTKEAKVELKDFDSTTIKMRLTAKNLSNDEVTYKVDAITLKDAIDVSTGEKLNMLTSDYVDAKVSGTDTVVVPANGSKNFQVTIDISNDVDVRELGDMFIEGFIKLNEVTDTHNDLTVPFGGYYGEWDKPNIIDGLMTSDHFGKSYFDYSGFGHISNDGIYFYDEDIYMNPGTVAGEVFGYGNVLPILSFLRNAETVNYKIADSQGNELRNISTSKYVRKNYIDGGRNNPFTIVEDALWDGKVDGEYVEDGEYIYKIEAKIDYKDAKYQTYEMPIVIDTLGPEVTDIKYDNKTKELSFKAKDENAGLNLFEFMIDGEFVGELTLNAKEGQEEYSLTLPDSTTDKSKVAIVAYDNIYNYSESEVSGFAEEEPYIYILQPDLLDVYNQSEIKVEGYVTNVNYLDKVLINEDIEANIKFLESVKVEDGSGGVLINGPAYKFTKNVELEDGYKEMRVKAITENGKESSLIRRFYVDTTAPTLEAEVLEREIDSSKATIRLHMSDNLDYLKLKQSDSEIYKKDGFNDAVKVGPVEETYDYEVDLEVGENKFNFTLFDIVDQTAETEVNISREEVSNSVSRVSGSDRYKTAVEVSKEQYDSAENVILASGGSYSDSLASSPLAVNLDAPILLNPKYKLNEDTLTEIERLQVKNIYIIGDNSSISRKVERELKSKGLNIYRIAGKNREQTAIKIGEHVVDGNNVDTAIIVNGYKFPDILSASAVAADNGYPILFVNSNKIKKETMNALADWNIEDVKIIGGESVVNKNIENKLSSLYSVERIAETDREGTSIEVAKKFFPDSDSALMVNGYDFPDGLVSGALAGKLNTPILLVSRDNLTNDMKTYIRESKRHITILGGPTAVNENVEQTILEIISR
nr:cell wall-binding repeat-containing protein [Anaeromonas gelatinilytica]